MVQQDVVNYYWIPNFELILPIKWLFFIKYVLNNLAAIVEGDQKAPFSTATTRRWREGATPFPGLLHFTLDTYLILLSVKQDGIKYTF